MTSFQITQFSNDTRYAPAVARVRVLETQLLSQQKLFRMAEESDWEGVLEELRATDYAEPLAKVRTPIDIETALLQVLKHRYCTIHELAIETTLIQAIISWHDFNNLKILFKQKYIISRHQWPFSDLGMIKSDVMKNALENKFSLPPQFQRTIENVLQDYNKHQKLFRLEMLVDRHYLKYILDAFENCQMPFLKFFVNYRIDLIKIMMILRWQCWNEKSEMPFELLPSGGFLTDDKLSALSSEGWEKIASLLQFSPYGNLLLENMEYLCSANDLWLLEKLSDDFITNFCELSRYTPYGVEPLLAFSWISLQEFRNVQFIVTAKQAGISPKKIKSRLRKTYA